jgi:hypothetical protein
MFSPCLFHLKDKQASADEVEALRSEYSERLCSLQKEHEQELSILRHSADETAKAAASVRHVEAHAEGLALK